MVIKELSNLSNKELKQVKSVITFFHLLGMTDEQIASLPQVLSNWPIVAKNMNAMSKDLIEVKSMISDLSARNGSKSADDKKLDTSENIKEASGIGKDIERINFGSFSGNGK